MYTPYILTAALSVTSVISTNLSADTTSLPASWGQEDGYQWLKPMDGDDYGPINQLILALLAIILSLAWACFGGWICTPWAIPCQLSKCCHKYRWRRPRFPASDVHFKPYGDDTEAIECMLTTYKQLSDGTHFKPRSRAWYRWIVYRLRYVLLLVPLILFLPVFTLIVGLGFSWYLMRQSVRIIHGFLMLRCRCRWIDEYLHPDPLSKRASPDKWTDLTTVPSLEEQRRFDLYIMPLVLANVGSRVYWWLCWYLAGLFEANLIEDDIIVYLAHLEGTTKCRFVYEYDSDKKPVRIIGLMDDYTLFTNEGTHSKFFPGMSFEIESLFIDYDDDNRITFTLRNGTKVVQPRGDRAGAVADDEMRIWNIVKAHYQCQMTLWPSLVHTWVHFHFNDLVIGYIEQQWTSGDYECTDNVMDRIIRSHSYYTAVLNSAGPSDGFFHPQTSKPSRCLYLCAPWKVTPVVTAVIGERFVTDITRHWFKDKDDEEEDAAKVVELEVNAEESQTLSVSKKASKKTADPDAFPPNFVRNRLEMFEDEFPSKKEWISMHRGYHIYKDFLADYYRVIHEEFTLKLHDAGFIKSGDLQRFVGYLEDEGFPGILECQRDGGYLHIVSTFLWLNVAHTCDHAIADNIVRNFGIGASAVPMHSEEWYRENGGYDFVDVLEGKSCLSRWRLQFRSMKIRLFWDTFGGPWNEGGFHADHLIDSHLHRHFVDVKGLGEDDRKEVNAIHRAYIAKMKECDEKYHWLYKVENFTAGIQY